MLACELALGGAKARLLEERTDMPNITRAFAVHARTLELLDARGLAGELLPRGVPVREVAPPGGTTLDLRELPTRFGMVLIVPQSGTERVLQARADELGVEIVRGAEVVGLSQDGDGVTVECAGGDGVRAELRHRMRRRTQHRAQPARYRLRRQAIRDTHPVGRRAADQGTERDVDGRHQREGRGARHSVRRRLVPRDRVGPTARTGTAAGTGDGRGNPRLVSAHRGP